MGAQPQCPRGSLLPRHPAARWTSSGVKTLVAGDARWWLPKRGKRPWHRWCVWRDAIARTGAGISGADAVLVIVGDRTCRSQAEDYTCAARTCRDVERGVTENPRDPACAAFSAHGY